MIINDSRENRFKHSHNCLTSEYTDWIRQFRFFFIVHRFDGDKDRTLNLNELKLLMEKLGMPQTHVRLKDMIKQVDEDHDGKINFREVRATESMVKRGFSFDLVPWNHASSDFGDGPNEEKQLLNR